MSDSDGSFELVVIGAGINGAGVAHDAARRGLKVALLDKGDVGSGTTSTSTRLVHGGLRYLEHAEFGLVRESLRERAILLRVAPHLVRWITLMIPFYSGAGRHRWLIRTGLTIYDLLSAGGGRPRHRALSREEALAREPGLNPSGLRGAATYADAQVEFPERLALENALAAIRHGADLRTYARVDELVIAGGRVRGVRYTDSLTGKAGELQATVVVNAAGPWVDRVLEGTAVHGQRLVGGTKGSHIVVSRFPGAPTFGLYAEAPGDRRPFFIVPWNDLVLIGTTDSPYPGDPDGVDATPDEVDYLVAATNRLIPAAGLTESKVLYTWSGVRPLPSTPGTNPGAITRRHFIHDHAPQADGLFSLVGGKITTYRHLAELAVDQVMRKLGRRGESTTSRSPLPGAEAAPAEVLPEVAARAGLAAAAPRLVRLYGSRALEIATLARAAPELARPIALDGRAVAAEIDFSITAEHARTLGDILLRRTMLGLDPALSGGEVMAVAHRAAAVSGWSSERTATELRRYEEERARNHASGGAGRSPVPT